MLGKRSEKCRHGLAVGSRLPDRPRRRPDADGLPRSERPRAAAPPTTPYHEAASGRAGRCGARRGRSVCLRGDRTGSQDGASITQQSPTRHPKGGSVCNHPSILLLGDVAHETERPGVPAYLLTHHKGCCIISRTAREASRSAQSKIVATMASLTRPTAQWSSAGASRCHGPRFRRAFIVSAKGGAIPIGTFSQLTTFQPNS